MTNEIIPAIVKDSCVREQEAKRLAAEVERSAQADVVAAIERYGQFVSYGLPPLHAATKDFCRAVVSIRAYQDMIEPLRPYRALLDEFDDHFAAEVHRLSLKRMPRWTT